jgi:Fe-S cluster assembly scaffold protein SufB
VPLAQAYEALPLLVEQYSGKVATFDGQTFTALNTAFLDDGAVLHVGRTSRSRGRSTCCS